MKTKKVLGVALAGCLLASCGFAVTACGEGDYIKVATVTELQNALAVEENDIKIALTQDITFEDFTDSTTVNSGASLIRISRGKNVIINLKGHKLSAIQDNAVDGYTSFIHVQDDASLVLDNGEVTYTYSAGEESDYTGDATIWCEGTLVTNNVNIKIDMSQLSSLGFAIDLRPNIWNSENIIPQTPASVTLNNSQVWASNADCVRICNNSGEYAAHQLETLIVNNSTLESVDGYGAGIFVQQLDSVFNPVSISVKNNSDISGYYAIRIYTQVSTWSIPEAVDVETPIHNIIIDNNVTLTDEVEVNGTTTVNTNIEGIVLRCGAASAMDDYRQLTYVNGEVVTVA